MKGAQHIHKLLKKKHSPNIRRHGYKCSLQLALKRKGSPVLYFHTYSLQIICLKKVNPPWDEQCRSQPCSGRSPPPSEGQASLGVPTASQPGCSSHSNARDRKHDLCLHQGQKSINIPSWDSCRAACCRWTALQTACNGLPWTRVRAHSSRGGLHKGAFHRALVQESLIQSIAPFYTAKLPFFYRDRIFDKNTHFWIPLLAWEWRGHWLASLKSLRHF